MDMTFKRVAGRVKEIAFVHMDETSGNEGDDLTCPASLDLGNRILDRLSATLLSHALHPLPISPAYILLSPFLHLPIRHALLQLILESCAESEDADGVSLVGVHYLVLR
jgi:hypothetical protein